MFTITTHSNDDIVARELTLMSDLMYSLGICLGYEVNLYRSKTRDIIKF